MSHAPFVSHAWWRGYTPLWLVWLFVAFLVVPLLPGGPVLAGALWLTVYAAGVLYLIRSGRRRRRRETAYASD